MCGFPLWYQMAVLPDVFKEFFNEDGSEPLPEDAEYEPQNVEECVEAMKKHGGFTMNINKLFTS